MSRDHLAGAGELVRVALRRDRLRLPLWVGAVAALVWIQAASVEGLYPTREDLARAAEVIGDNPAFVAMAGPPVALDTLGGRVVFEIGALAMVLAALMSTFSVVRHTRGDEESGRAELVRAAAVGRHAPLAAALAVTLAADAVLAVAVAAAVLPVGVPLAGSVAFGLAVGGVGAVFAGVAAVTAQVTPASRTASGLAGAALSVAYAVRAAGDVGDGRLSWLSPLGWGQAVRPFGGERWWALGLLAATTGALVAVAVRLAARRDLGAGLVADRPGPAVAAPSLWSPAGLSARLLRGTIAGWAAGLAFAGVAYGAIGEDVADLVADDDFVAEVLAQHGGDLVDSFLATTSLVLALLASGFAVQGVLRLRGEEQAGRAELVLAGPVARTRWAGSHLAVVAAGVAAVLAAGGFATGVTFAVVAGGVADVARTTAAALVHLPAVLVLAAAAAAVHGWAPRAAPLGWLPMLLCAFEGLLGEALSLPAWASDLSPFRHVPALPAEPFSAVPLLVLLAVAAALAACGVAGLQRRDVNA